MATIKGTSGVDILPLQGLLGILSSESDQLYGYEGNDILIGGAGNDYLEGGVGNDVLIGGTLGVILNIGDIDLSGADTAGYRSSSAGVTIDLGAMQDLQLSLLGISAGLQKAVTGHGGDAEGDTLIGIANLTGSAFTDYLSGDAGANILNGAGGADFLAGGLGNDTYFVDNAGDTVTELVGGGTDRLFTSVSFALGVNQEIEKLAVTDSESTDKVNLNGNAFKQTLMGNNGENILNGGAGADKMYGFGGNDTFYVDHSSDKVFESANGTDTVYTSVNWALGAGQLVEAISVLNPSGTTRININGNELGQTITGSAGSNVINGGGGNDRIFGLGGGDRIYAGTGNDVITGGAGNDLFVFDLKPHASTNHTTITDFGIVGGNNDEIYLENAIFTTLRAGGLVDDAFVANLTGKAADAEDRIIYETDTGKLFYDVNGSAAGGSILFATLTNLPTLTSNDFVVI